MDRQWVQFLWTLLFLVLLQFPKYSYTNGIDNNLEETEYKKMVKEGDDFGVKCSFPLIKTNYDDDYDDSKNINLTNEIDIVWIYPDEEHIKINGSHIKEERYYLSNSIHSVLTVLSGKSETDKGYYICLYYKDRVLLEKKLIHVDFINVTTTNTKTIIIVISLVLILIILILVALYLLHRFKKKPNSINNPMFATYDRNNRNSCMSTIELTTY